MKTYTLEELRLAQAKGCRIEWKGIDNDWRTLNDSTPSYLNSLKYGMLRIHPDDEWKARLPRLKEGAEWACDGHCLAEGERPHVVGELIDGLNGYLQKIRADEIKEELRNFISK